MPGHWFPNIPAGSSTSVPRPLRSAPVSSSVDAPISWAPDSKGQAHDMSSLAAFICEQHEQLLGRLETLSSQTRALQPLRQQQQQQQQHESVQASKTDWHVAKFSTSDVTGQQLPSGERTIQVETKMGSSFSSTDSAGAFVNPPCDRFPAPSHPPECDTRPGTPDAASSAGDDSGDDQAVPSANMQAPASVVQLEFQRSLAARPQLTGFLGSKEDPPSELSSQGSSDSMQTDPGFQSGADTARSPQTEAPSTRTALRPYEERVANRWHLSSAKKSKYMSKTFHSDCRVPSRWSRTRAASEVSGPGKFLRLRVMLLTILSSPVFDVCMACVLAINLVMLGVETVTSKDLGRVPAYARFCEYGCLAIYLVELVCHLFLHGRHCMRFAWFRLDAFTIGAGVIDITLRTFPEMFFDNHTRPDDLILLRMLRLSRMVRAVRLLVNIKPLYMLVHGMQSSFTTLMWTFVIVAALVYIFGIVGYELIKEDLSDDPVFKEVYRKHFSNFGLLTLTLMRAVTLDSVADIYTPVIVAAPWLSTYFILFILTASISLMNLVTAVLVETARQTASQDAKARKASMKNRAKVMIPQLEALFCAMDTNRSGEVELREVLAAPQWVLDQLEALSNRTDIEEIFKVLDYDGSGTVSIAEFLDGVMRAGDDGHALEIVRIMNLCLDIRSEIRTLRGGDNAAAGSDSFCDTTSQPSKVPG